MRRVLVYDDEMCVGGVGYEVYERWWIEYVKVYLVVEFFIIIFL